MAKKILTVEDAPNIRKLIAYNLKRAGYEVFEAEDGKAAVRVLNQLVPDLIILDIRMPEMDGFALLELMRKYPKAAAIPVIMLTALSTAADLDRALQLGVVDYLVKPLDPTLLIAKWSPCLRARACPLRWRPRRRSGSGAVRTAGSSCAAAFTASRFHPPRGGGRVSTSARGAVVADEDPTGHRGDRHSRRPGLFQQRGHSRGPVARPRRVLDQLARRVSPGRRDVHRAPGDGAQRRAPVCPRRAAPRCAAAGCTWRCGRARQRPVLIRPQLVATARSAMVVSSVSPERCDITALQPARWAVSTASSVSLRVPIWLTLTRMALATALRRMPSRRRAVLVTKRSSPTSWTLPPRRRQRLPAVPVVLGHAVLDRQDRVAGAEVLVVVDHRRRHRASAPRLRQDVACRPCRTRSRPDRARRRRRRRAVAGRLDRLP
jgi:CheY-like chemotaxis protein